MTKEADDSATGDQCNQTCGEQQVQDFVRNWNELTRKAREVSGEPWIDLIVVLRKSGTSAKVQESSFTHQTNGLFNGILDNVARHLDVVDRTSFRITVFMYAGSVNHDALLVERHLNDMQDKVTRIVDSIETPFGKHVLFTSPDRFARSVRWHQYLWHEFTTSRGMRILVHQYIKGGGHRVLSDPAEILAECHILELRRRAEQHTFFIKKHTLNLL